MAQRRRRTQSQQNGRTLQPSQPTTLPSPGMVINPLIAMFLAQQQLAERGVEQAYQQAMRSVFRQMRARGLEPSGITAGAAAYLGGQMASQIGDIRARTASEIARAQLEMFQNLLNLAIQREAAALQVAKSAPAREILQQTTGQLGQIVNALTGLVGLGYLPSPLASGTTPSSALPSPTTPPLILNPTIYRV